MNEMDLKTYLDERLVFIHYREKKFFFRFKTMS